MGSVSRPSVTAGDWRWRALVVLCAGMLMVVLDATIVNVALPSIRSDLGFAPSVSLEDGLAAEYRWLSDAIS